MEEMDNFERLIKERLEGNESPVSDRIWVNIQSSLPTEREKKPLRLLYFMLAGVVAIASGLLYFSIKDINSSPKSLLENEGISNSSVETKDILVENKSHNEWNQEDNGGNKTLNEYPSVTKTEREETAGKKNVSAVSGENLNISKDTPKNFVTKSLKNNHNYITIEKQRIGRNNHSDLKKREKNLHLSFSASDKKWDEIINGKKENASVTYSNSDLYKETKQEKTSDDNNSVKEDKKTEELKDFSSQNNFISKNQNNIHSSQYNSKDTAFVNNDLNENYINDIEKKNSVSVNSNGNENSGLNKSNSDKEKENVSDNVSDQSDINSYSKTIAVNSAGQNGENGQNTKQENILKVNTIVAKNNSTEDSLQKETSKEEQAKETEQKKKKSKKEFSIPEIEFETFLTPTLSKSKLSENTVQNNIGSDKAKFALGAGMRMNINIGERFRAGIGLGYSSYGDRSVINSSSDKELLYVNYNIVKDTNGAWVYIPKDTVKFKKSFSNKQVAVNSFKYISIPIFAGYKVLDGKFGLTITGGVTANILTHAETNTFIRNSNSTVIINTERSKGDNNPFRPLVFSVFVSPGVSYKINDNLRIIFDPGFTWFLNSVYKSDYFITRKIMALECRTGVQFTLGK